MRAKIHQYICSIFNALIISGIKRVGMGEERKVLPNISTAGLLRISSKTKCMVFFNA